MTPGERPEGRWRISPGAAGLAILTAIVYWHYGGRPLYHTDLWGHLAYGRWIAVHGRLPPHEPFMPLANDAAIVDTAWLSQLAGYAMYRWAGLAGLRCLYGAVVAACCGLLAWTVHRRTRSVLASAIALGGLAGLQWFQVIRPQALGLLCFVILQALLGGLIPRRLVSRVAPILFVLWANLHGSFGAGLVLLAACAMGRMIDAWWKTRTRCGVLHDRRMRKLWGLTAVAFLATMVNPYGPRLHAEVMTFADNPNLKDIIEWLPLDFEGKQGMIFAGLAGLIVAAGFAAGRRIPAAVWLPVAIFSVATIASARMIVWWSPLALALLADEIATIAGRWSPAWFRRTPMRSGAWTALAAAFFIAALVDTPPMRGRGRSPDEVFRESVSPETPVAAVDWLARHPPSGQVFNTYAWGDYLAWTGSSELAPFVTSQVQWVPPAVWRDYRSISRGASGCLERLDAYRAETVLIDREVNSVLAGKLEADRRWRREYADPLAVIYRRQSPDR